MRINHDDQALDIINKINQALHDADLLVQFKIDDEDSDDVFLEFSLVETEEIINY